jgi:hypothetical protein
VWILGYLDTVIGKYLSGHSFTDTECRNCRRIVLMLTKERDTYFRQLPFRRNIHGTGDILCWDMLGSYIGKTCSDKLVYSQPASFSKYCYAYVRYMSSLRESRLMDLHNQVGHDRASGLLRPIGLSKPDRAYKSSANEYKSADFRCYVCMCADMASS